MSKILLTDDDVDIRRLIATRLAQEGYEVRAEECCEGLRRALAEEDFDTVLLDFYLPDGDGISLLKEIREVEPALPVIMITAHGSIERAVEAMRAGAYDFTSKPIDWNRLLVSVKNALDRRRLENRLRKLERSKRSGLCGMIGGSDEMQVVYQIIETVAPTKASVLITGESGTGKELVARAIHELSPRREKDLVDVNCAAIPKELLESELFGHEPNSFTGAKDRYIGRCERAHQSTLFMDEIAEMNYSLQAKILRFLQEYTFYRVGGKEKITVDARIVSATNRDPMQAIHDQQFREDLYYRLNVVRITMPPLRDRPEDIPELADYFLEKYAAEHGKPFRGIAANALDALCCYSWPGNVRELENSVQQSVVLHQGETLTIEMLPRGVREAGEKALCVPRDQAARDEKGTIIPFEIVEREAIENALRITQGSVPKASTALHLSQATIYRKIREYNINIKQYKIDG